MSATTAGALKACIEGLSLSLTAFRDQAPADATLPYVVVHEGVSRSREAHGDQGDPNAHRAVTELVQVDLWQAWRNEDGSLAESYTLAEALVAGIDGAPLATAPKRVYGCTVDGSVRLVERDENLVHEAITVRLRRDL